jgi:hypothetical protein
MTRLDYEARMGPHGVNLSVAALAAAELEDDARLNAARDSFPGWEITDTFGGYMAVPKGTAVVRATDLDGLVLKLRQQEA